MPTHTLLRPSVVAEERFRLYGKVTVPCRAPYVASVCALLGLLAGLVFIAVTTHYTEREAVRGYLLPGQGIARIAAPRAGVVDRVFVRPGATVHKGDPLVRVTSESALDAGHTLAAAIAGNLERRNDELAEQRRLAATKLERGLQAARNDRQSLRAELQVAEAQLATQQRWLDAAEQRLTAYRRAAAAGSVPALDVSRLEGEALNGELQRQTIERQRVVLAAQIERSLEQERDLYTEHRAALSTIELRRVDVDDRALDNDRMKGQIVVAPMDGVVASRAVTSGAEVAAGKELMVIAPVDAAMVAHVFVPVTAIGFVAPGQRVSIQYDSFPHREFGTFSGRVREIADFAFDRRDLEVELTISEPVFRVLVDLEVASVSVASAEVAFKPGMTFDAHVQTRRMKVAKWLFEPLLRFDDIPFGR